MNIDYIIIYLAYKIDSCGLEEYRNYYKRLLKEVIKYNN